MTRPDTGRSGARIPERPRDFSFQNVHIGPGAIPASRLVDTWRSFCYIQALRNRSYTGRFIMFSVTTNIYNKKTKGPTLMELFTATGKPKKKQFCFYN